MEISSALVIMCENRSALEASFDAFRLPEVTRIVEILLRRHVELFQTMWNWEYLLFSKHGLRFSAKDINICISLCHRIILLFLVERCEEGLRHHSRALILNHGGAFKVLGPRISETHLDLFNQCLGLLCRMISQLLEIFLVDLIEHILVEAVD